MNIFKKTSCRSIAVYLAFTCLMMACVPRDLFAYVIEPAKETQRGVDTAKIQRVMESKILSQRLSELGLSLKDIRSRLDRLSDDEIHKFASRIDKLYAGGDVVGVVIGILIIAILILTVLKLSGHKVIIK